MKQELKELASYFIENTSKPTGEKQTSRFKETVEKADMLGFNIDLGISDIVGVLLARSKDDEFYLKSECCSDEEGNNIILTALRYINIKPSSNAKDKEICAIRKILGSEYDITFEFDGDEGRTYSSCSLSGNTKFAITVSDSEENAGYDVQIIIADYLPDEDEDEDEDLFENAPEYSMEELENMSAIEELTDAVWTELINHQSSAFNNTVHETEMIPYVSSIVKDNALLKNSNVSSLHWAMIKDSKKIRIYCYVDSKLSATEKLLMIHSIKSHDFDQFDKCIDSIDGMCISISAEKKPSEIRNNCKEFISAVLKDLV